MNLNKIFLLGRLTRDPENRALPSGSQVTSFGLATDRFYVDKSNQKQKETEFHNITLFGRLAEIAGQYLKKGALVLIEGRIKTRSWQDNQGNKKYRTEIIGERMQLGPKSATADGKTNNTAPVEQMPAQEEIPVIEEGEINVKDIPF
ncbi:MAG: single-stranded DNA-binding protein [bacterium]